jgi:hypothetical protein
MIARLEQTNHLTIGPYAGALEKRAIAEVSPVSKPVAAVLSGPKRGAYRRAIQGN